MCVRKHFYLICVSPPSYQEKPRRRKRNICVPFSPETHFKMTLEGNPPQGETRLHGSFEKVEATHRQRGAAESSEGNVPRLWNIARLFCRGWKVGTFLCTDDKNHKSLLSKDFIQKESVTDHHSFSGCSLTLQALYKSHKRLSLFEKNFSVQPYR